MNSQEALQVLRKVVGYQPSQRIDTLTAEAWSEALEPYDVRDALDAVAKIAVSPRVPGQPFWMEVRDIVQEVQHAEKGRLDRNMSKAHELESAIHDRSRDPKVDWAQEMRELRRALRSRDWTPPPPKPELPVRPVRSLAKEIGAIRNGAHPPRGVAALTDHERRIAAEASTAGREAFHDDANPYELKP